MKMRASVVCVVVFCVLFLGFSIIVAAQDPGCDFGGEFFGSHGQPGSGGGGGGTGNNGLAAPSDLSAYGTGQEVHLQWTNNATAATQVRIQEQDDSGVWAWRGTVDPTTTTWVTRVGVTPEGSNYCFRVHALDDSGGKSDFSNAVCVTMFSAPPSDPPKNLQPDGCIQNQPNPLRPQFRWDSPARAAGFYLVLQDVLSGTTVINNPNLGPRGVYNYDVRVDLKPNWDYRFKVKAVNNMGPGPWAPYRPFNTVCTAPAAPVRFTATAAGYKVSLNWAEADLEANFALERTDDINGLWSVVASLPRGTTNYLDLVPPPPAGGSVTYNYRLTAINHWGSTASATQTHVKIYDAPPSDAPTGGLPIGCVRTATATFHTTISWNPVDKAESYHVIVDHPVGNPVGIVMDRYVTGTSTPSGDLSWGTPISIQESACNNMGCGPSSPVQYFAGCAPEGLPIKAPAPGCVDSLRLSVNWTPAADAITGHRLIVMDIASGKRVVDVQLGTYANGYAIPFDLTAGDEYSAQVLTSPANSRPRYFRPMCADGELPGSVSLVARMGGSDTNAWKNSFFIWEAAAQATQYHLVVVNASGAAELDQTLSALDICGAGQCSVLSPQLTPGPHTWQVQAINPAGTGPWTKKLPFTVRQ